jgi:hypothetical protein
MDEMDDEAFARMLQQQLLDEELAMEQSNNQQNQGLTGHNNAPPQPFPASDSYAQQRQQQPHDPYAAQHDPYYDPQPTPPSSYQQTPSPGNYRRTGYRNPPPSSYNQPPPDNYQQHHYQQQSTPPSQDPYQQQQQQQQQQREQPTNEEDPDLALARRLHMLEIRGEGSVSALGVHPPRQQDSPGFGGGASGGKTREEQEVEDSRLARLMMDTGQSFRDLDSDMVSRSPRVSLTASSLASIPQERISDPPPEPSRQQPPSPMAEYVPIVPQFSSGSSSPSVEPRSSLPRRVAPPMSRTSGTINLSKGISPTRKVPPVTPSADPSDPSDDLQLDDAFLDASERLKKEKEKKKKRGIFGFRKPDDSSPGGEDEEAPATSERSRVSPVRGYRRQTSGGGNKRVTPANVAFKSDSGDAIRPLVPFPIPEPVARPADTIGARKGPLPYSLSVSRDIPQAPEATVGRRLLGLGGGGTCSACNRSASNPLTALDKKYHNECFKCIACHEQIDSTGPFAFIENSGDKEPLHRKCYGEMFGIKCAVCTSSIAAGPNGTIQFVKHPFFDTEQMCPRHAKNMTRRCTGCHRFEPEQQPFADLNDVGRCVCLSCCRTVVVDSSDAQPLWAQVIDFFEQKLNLPIWKDFREVPVLIVGYSALNDQMSKGNNVHGGASQIMTRGLCLTEHESGRRFRSDMMKFDKNNKTFVSSDAEDRGFTYFQVPDASKVNPDASVTAILCLSGLPKDLTASVLAHEATHAWIKLHPSFDIQKPIPPQVEEGVAQLIALLFLNEGLDPAPPLEYNDGSGPSDEKLRQYFKFSIETDEHELYGTGYRRAAMAYSMIGIEALMSHIVLYQDFPET